MHSWRREEYWRVILNLDSLIAHLLKGKYFLSTSLMWAKQGYFASWGWKIFYWKWNMMAEWEWESVMCKLDNWILNSFLRQLNVKSDHDPSMVCISGFISETTCEIFHRHSLIMKTCVIFCVLLLPRLVMWNIFY